MKILVTGASGFIGSFIVEGKDVVDHLTRDVGRHACHQ